MKTKTYFLIIVVGMESLFGMLQAQCFHNISTNPNNPINHQFDSIFPGKTNVFVNTFD